MMINTTQMDHFIYFIIYFNIIFHIFRDVGETVGENIIVDMKLIRDASSTGYTELRNILLGRYMYSPELS